MGCGQRKRDGTGSANRGGEGVHSVGGDCANVHVADRLRGGASLAHTVQACTVRMAWAAWRELR